MQVQAKKTNEIKSHTLSIKTELGDANNKSLTVTQNSQNLNRNSNQGEIQNR